LIVPDAPVPVARPGGANMPNVGFGVGGGFGGGGFAPSPPPLLAPISGSGAPAQKLEDFAKQLDKNAEGKDPLADLRGGEAAKRFKEAPADEKGGKALKKAEEQKAAFEAARAALSRRDLDGVQAGRLGVDLSLQTHSLRTQTRLTQTALRRAGNRNLMEIGGVWIDDSFNAKMPVVSVKAMSTAYFRILERHAMVRDVYRLGNHLVWVTPSGTALIIDVNNGRDEMPDADIDRLFVAAPKK
jgi:Ca-activated chloride channel family protein